MTDISGICPKCKANVGLLLRDLAHGECAYCTTRSSSITEEQAKELIQLGEKAMTSKTAEREAKAKLLELVEIQACSDSLWFPTLNATEAYLQRALRELHAAIENLFPLEFEEVDNHD